MVFKREFYRCDPFDAYQHQILKRAHKESLNEVSCSLRNETKIWCELVLPVRAVVSSETKSGCPGATVIMSVSPNRPAKRCICFSAEVLSWQQLYEQDVEKDRYGDMSRLLPTSATDISLVRNFGRHLREIETFEMIMPATEWVKWGTHFI